jgi:hypothetical protein
MEIYERAEVFDENIQFNKRLIKGSINKDAGGDN